MRFSNPIVKGKILKRYKRFLADVELDSGEVIVAHTANTGSMATCWEPGWKVLMSHHDNPKRKLKYSLEMTHNGETWIGVNTSWPNKLSYEAIESRVIVELSDYQNIRPEIKIGASRIDLLLHNGKEKDGLDDSNRCYVEVKNVTLKGNGNLALFPDAVSTRGQKHLRELIQLKQQGLNAAMLFVVQREDVARFSPADEIDPEYGKLLRQAEKAGVQILVYGCQLDENEIKITKPLKLNL
jgi:sugar fermentation stimulation protein A